MQHARTPSGKIALIGIMLLALPFLNLNAQSQTVGLFQYDLTSSEGYTLFSPMGSQVTFLMDNYGRLVHSWESDYIPNLAVYLLENGNLIRTSKTQDGSMDGGVQILEWDGTVVWEIPWFGDDYVQHHDIEPLPNGNVLLLVRDDKTQAEAIAMGRDPALMNDTILSTEYIVELEPTGPTSYDIIWEWHFWDHLIQDFDSTRANYGVVEEHPELLDINFAKHSRPDWIHLNALAYNPDLDQIAMSSRPLNEIYIIDHSTSTAEAAGHSGGNSGMGGDILYRWGNPQSYRAGTVNDQQFFAEHDVHWINPGLPGEGNLLVFNNGSGRPEGNYSTVEEIVTPVDEFGNYAQPDPGTPFGPAEPIWIYQADNPTDFYSGNISGAQRLPNGNTLICEGATGEFFEVTPAGDIVWEYINPVTSLGILQQGEPLGSKSNSVFRCLRYTSEYPGLIGKDLSPGALIELYPITIAGTTHSPQIPLATDSVIITAYINGDNEIVSAELYINTGGGYVVMIMYDDGLHHDELAGDDIYGVAVSPLMVETTAYYYINAEDDSATTQFDPPNATDIVYNFVTTAMTYICGDSNADETVNVSDAVYVINYVFAGGDPPDPIESGDTNCDGTCNVSDAVWLINYVFTGGNDPCDTDGDDVPDC